MSRRSYHILRIGLAITFIWIGVLILKAPEAWGGYLQPWAVSLLPFSVKKALIGTAIFDIVVGVLFLINRKAWLAGLLGTSHLAIVLITSGVTDITVRDIGLMAATLAAAIESMPSRRMA